MKKLLLATALSLLSGIAYAQQVTSPSITAIACAYNSATQTGTSGQFMFAQCDANGRLLVSGSAPTGAAGGSLKGTYPNPGLADINTIATSLAIGGATIGTDALAWTGTATGSGRLSVGGVTNTGNGAASVSNSLWNGTIFTGGTGTTNFPAVFIQPTGATAVTSFSTAGTAFGVNAPSGFTGNFLDFHVNGGGGVFVVNSGGSVTASNVTLNNTSQVGWTGRGIITSPTSGSIQLGATDAATVVAQTLRASSIVAGTAAANGANTTLIASLPTGTGTSGDWIFQTGVKTGSGTTQGIPTTALTIKGETQQVIAATTLVVSGMTNVATTSAVCYNTGTGLLTYDGTLGTCTVSDERLKNLGSRIPDALERLLKINGVYYTWKDPTWDRNRQIGVSAQAVESVFPELVQTDSLGRKSMDYQRLTAPIIEALRQLKADNDNLRAEIKSIKRSTR